MFQANSSGREQLEALRVALGFDWNDQDWGIVNADPRRVEEFVSFFEQNHNARWRPETVAEFVDLVLESASAAVRNDPAFPVSCIDEFVTKSAPLVPKALAYWTSHEWAVTPHLRALGY